MLVCDLKHKFAVWQGYGLNELHLAKWESYDTQIQIPSALCVCRTTALTAIRSQRNPCSRLNSRQCYAFRPSSPEGRKPPAIGGFTGFRAARLCFPSGKDMLYVTWWWWVRELISPRRSRPLPESSWSVGSLAPENPGHHRESVQGARLDRCHTDGTDSVANWTRSGIHGSRPHVSVVLRRCLCQWEVQAISPWEFGASFLTATVRETRPPLWKA